LIIVKTLILKIEIPHLKFPDWAYLTGLACLGLLCWDYIGEKI